MNELDTAVEAIAGEVTDLAHRIHAHPELAFQERQAAAWLAAWLTQHGFHVEHGSGGVDTAFVARRSGGGPGPVVAYLAEYDALPGVGHGCGHNLMGTSSAAAAIAVTTVLGDSFAGEIRVIGTPAEESGFGKADLVRAGVLADVDVALQVHPNNRSAAAIELLAIADRAVTFHGRAAHAVATPWEGRSALDAVVGFFVAISQLRLYLPAGDSVHGIITDGGEAPNIVPARTSARFFLRSRTDDGLAALIARFTEIAHAAAAATACTAEVGPGVSANMCRTMWNNPTLVTLWSRAWAAVGGTDGGITPAMGSSDMGNISQVVPTIHPYVQIAPAGTPLHSDVFALAAISVEADAVLLRATRALADLGVDLIRRPELVQAARAAFEEQRSASAEGRRSG